MVGLSDGASAAAAIPDRNPRRDSIGEHFIYANPGSQSDGVTKILNQDGHANPSILSTDLARHRGFPELVTVERVSARHFGLVVEPSLTAVWMTAGGSISGLPY